jgi:hypothetical protein
LVTGFIEHLQIVTTSNCSANANSHILQFSTARAKASQSAVSSPVVAWQRLPTPYLPQLPYLQPYWPATVSELSARLAAISHQPPIRLTAVSRLSRNRSCSSLYSLGMDRIENTSPNSSIVASRSCHTDRIKNTTSHLLCCCMLRICCLATGVFTEPFPSNGSLLVSQSLHYAAIVSAISSVI